MKLFRSNNFYFCNISPQLHYAAVKPVLFFFSSPVHSAVGSPQNADVVIKI